MGLGGWVTPVIKIRILLYKRVNILSRGLSQRTQRRVSIRNKYMSRGVSTGDLDVEMKGVKIAENQLMLDFCNLPFTVFIC